LVAALAPAFSSRLLVYPFKRVNHRSGLRFKPKGVTKTDTTVAVKHRLRRHIFPLGLSRRHTVSAVKYLLHNFGRCSRCQGFGHDFRAVRDSDHYRKEYVHALVERWDLLIDWAERCRQEGGFIANALRDRGAARVLDAAAGTGVDSIQLIQAGFEVTSLDGHAGMLAKARRNAKRHGVRLHSVNADWRRIGSVMEGRYDAVICLGNSIAHLFTVEDQRVALAAFYRCLKPHGTLLVDHFDDAVLRAPEAFQGHRRYYTGAGVRVSLEYADRGLLRFAYTFPLRWIFFLHFFPLRRQSFIELLSTVGFRNIYLYPDCRMPGDVAPSEFILYRAEKR
jgi:SAM-dependent methyltransferase